jgi:hypothetical protein
MAADEPDDREVPAIGGPPSQRTLTVVVLLGLLATAGFGLRQLWQDPIRYGLDFPPFVDDADYPEAYLVNRLHHSVERTAGPYVGPEAGCGR